MPSIRLVDTDGTHYHPAPDASAGTESWQKTQRTERLMWSELRKAILYVEDSSGSRDDFFVDDCLLAR